MSLAEVILDIASDMEAEDAGTGTYALLKSYARQLRRAVKAAEGVTPTSTPHPARDPTLDAPRQDTLNKIIARKIEERGRMTEIAEGIVRGPTFRELVGGESDGTTGPLSPEAPVGAKTVVGIEVYELKEDGKLHFSEVETQKWQASKRQQKIILGS